MEQNLKIVVCTTAAESSWSNGLKKRHHGILEEMVKKTIKDINYSFQIALHRVHG